MLLSHFGVSAANLMNNILVYSFAKNPGDLRANFRPVAYGVYVCISMTYLCAWRICSERHDTVTSLLRYSKGFTTYVWTIFCTSAS